MKIEIDGFRKIFLCDNGETIGIEAEYIYIKSREGIQNVYTGGNIIFIRKNEVSIIERKLNALKHIRLGLYLCYNNHCERYLEPMLPHFYDEAIQRCPCCGAETKWGRKNSLFVYDKDKNRTVYEIKDD